MIPKSAERAWCRPVQTPMVQETPAPANEERRPTALWKQALGAIGLAKVLSSGSSQAAKRQSTYSQQAALKRASTLASVVDADNLPRTGSKERPRAFKRASSFAHAGDAESLPRRTSKERHSVIDGGVP